MDACGHQFGDRVSASILGSPRNTLHLRAGPQAVADRASAHSAGTASRISVRKSHKGPLSALTL